MMEQTVLFPIPLSELKRALQEIVKEEIRAKQTDELQEKLLSPKDACNLFTPAISLATLNNWSSKGLIHKYRLGGRTYYRYTDILHSLKTLKKYKR